MKTLFFALALVIGIGAVSSGCSPRLARTVVGAAVFGAALATTAHALHHYDYEYHQRHCYHTRRWRDGRWVYRCRGQWVYYDEAEDVWYAYD